MTKESLRKGLGESQIQRGDVSLTIRSDCKKGEIVWVAPSLAAKRGERGMQSCSIKGY